MIQQNYGKYIRDDGDALLRAYVEKPEKDVVVEPEPETLDETLSDDGAKCAVTLASPTGFEPVLPA
jgi:hypothetical protein